MHPFRTSNNDHSTHVNSTTKVGVPGETLPPKQGTQQERVLRRKEHIQEVGQALQEGRLPTTNQINQGLEKLTENNNFHDIASNMSPEGRKMMANAERLVDTTQKLLAEKNDNDQLQNIMYHTGRAGRNMKGGDDLTGAKEQLTGTAGEARNLASDGAESISRVAWLLVTSSQFRRLINDVTNILQETVTSNVPGHPGQSGESTMGPRTGESAYPNTQGIQAGSQTNNQYGNQTNSQYDNQANSQYGNQHISQGGAYSTPQSTDLEATRFADSQAAPTVTNTMNSAPGAMPDYQGGGHTSQAVPSAQTGLSGGVGGERSLGQPSASSHTGSHLTESSPSPYPHDVSQAQGVPGSVHHGEDREMMPGEARERARSTLKGSMAPAYFNAKEAARPYVHKAEQGEIAPLDAAVGVAKEMQSGLQEKVANMRLSPDQRTHLMQRVKAIFREVQGNPDFQMAVDELLSVMSGLQDHGRHVTSSAAETAASKREAGGDDIAIARANAKELVENFAGHKSLDPLFGAFRELSNKVSEDPELGEFVQDIKTFIHRSVREYEYVDRPGYTDDANRIVERGHAIMQGKYRGLFTRISNEMSDFNLALKRDRTSKRFVSDLETFAKDLFTDEFGHPTFKYDLVKDFARLIPIIAEKMDYIPLPRVEQSDEKMDVVLDNVVIQCSNILPKYVHIKTETVMDTDLHADQNLRNKVYIKLSNVQVQVRDAAFYYRMKTFPKMTDVGYMDVDMPEDGIEIDLLLNTNPPKGRKAHLYEVLDCNTRVNDLKLRIHGTKHSTAYKLLSPFINSKVKKVIEQMVPEKLTEKLVDIDDKIAARTEITLAKASLRKAEIEEGKRNSQPPQTTQNNEQWTSDAYDPTGPKGNRTSKMSNGL